MATINMAETLAEARRAIDAAVAKWKKDQSGAMGDIRFARAMLIRAEDALRGEIEIVEMLKK